ncbi:MAG: bacillithiol biosynthesis cysteine-adding enzyme BshC [Bacteroidetes bacterium]|nr:bacillithiol biosynthesis cysteine-adding enzyme BshC [Bacteroidota bacterium]
MESATTTDLQTRRISYDRLGASALFAAYVEGDEKAMRYVTHNPWEVDSKVEAARIAAAHPRDRTTLVDVLLEQNESWWGAEENSVRANIEQLRDPESVAVVTGQQLGLFGGPMHTIYKALTAVRLAEQLAEETGRPAVPVFWLAGEDHDFAEVHATTLPNGADPVRIVYDDGQPPDVNRGPVGRIVLGEQISESVEQLVAIHPQTPEWVRQVWTPGALWRDAFAHTLRRLTEGAGLVFVSGDDARLKRLAAPLFLREIEAWPDTFGRLTSVSSRLVEDGFHSQVKPSEVNLFLFAEDGRRLPIDPDGEGFVLRGTTERFSKEELLNLLEELPERFSPNVVLRPLMQDMLFPTAADVAGPGEMAYFAQLKPIYEAFGVPMPVIYPRASLTLVSEKQQRLLDKYEIDIPDLAGDVSQLHRRLALARADTNLDGEFDETARRIRELMAALKPTTTSVDSSLDSAVEAAHTRMEKALKRLEKKTIRAEKRNQHVILERLERLVGEIMPGGVPQERAMCALASLTKLAPVELLDVMGPDVQAHQVVNL